MLGRLDDKLDAIEATRALALPSSSSSTPVASNVKVNPGANLTTIAPVPGGRQKLSDCIRDLTCQWSEAFIELANEGDLAAMTLIAQMYLLPRGYGSIKFNKEEGMKWLFKAVDTGNVEARAMVRRMYPKELEEWLQKKGEGSSSKSQEELEKMLQEEKAAEDIAQR